VLKERSWTSAGFKITRASESSLRRAQEVRRVRHGHGKR